MALTRPWLSELFSTQNHLHVHHRATSVQRADLPTINSDSSSLIQLINYIVQPSQALILQDLNEAKLGIPY